jgi:hypothetical protein
MSVRLKLKADGSIEAVEADTVGELLEYQRQLQKKSQQKKQEEYSAIHLSPTAELVDNSIPERAKLLVTYLMKQPEGMDSAVLARHLGVEPRGVGGSITSLLSWGDRNGLSKRQMIRKFRRPTGTGSTVRGIALHSFFRKMIEEGKVPGMILDT